MAFDDEKSRSGRHDRERAYPPRGRRQQYEIYGPAKVIISRPDKPEMTIGNVRTSDVACQPKSSGISEPWPSPRSARECSSDPHPKTPPVLARAGSKPRPEWVRFPALEPTNSAPKPCSRIDFPEFPHWLRSAPARMHCVKRHLRIGFVPRRRARAPLAPFRRIRGFTEHRPPRSKTPRAATRGEPNGYLT